MITTTARVLPEQSFVMAASKTNHISLLARMKQFERPSIQSFSTFKIASCSAADSSSKFELSSLGEPTKNFSESQLHVKRIYLWSNILQSANEAAGKCSRMRCPLEYDYINFVVQHLLINWLDYPHDHRKSQKMQMVRLWHFSCLSLWLASQVRVHFDVRPLVFSCFLWVHFSKNGHQPTKTTIP